jgi:MoaA/NifB/PqqE/SkfB family radical SAM enzyme
MKVCSRVEIDTTKRCNAKCEMCFYKHSPDFNKDYDLPLGQLKLCLQEADDRGCDHALMGGWGEPMLYKFANEFVDEAARLGMTTSMITNALYAPERLKLLLERGMNHVHLSTHGIGATLDKVMGVNNSYSRQTEIKKMLAENNYPWRCNITLLKDNYQQVPEIVAENISYGVRHVVFLGFLPHYEWGIKKLDEVVVAPADMRPFIENAVNLCETAKVSISIRYFPMCHLSEPNWKYVVNSGYVLFDPWEWDYGHHGKRFEVVCELADKLCAAVSIKDYPCTVCELRPHCGGWNQTYANGFYGADLSPVFGKGIPKERGYLFEQNPANQLKGWF